MKIYNFYFHICQSDGKEQISFTHPPDLSSFLKIMEKNGSLHKRKKYPIMIMNCLIIGAPLIKKFIHVDVFETDLDCLMI